MSRHSFRRGRLVHVALDSAAQTREVAMLWWTAMRADRGDVPHLGVYPHNRSSFLTAGTGMVRYWLLMRRKDDAVDRQRFLGDPRECGLDGTWGGRGPRCRDRQRQPPDPGPVRARISGRGRRRHVEPD